MAKNTIEIPPFNEAVSELLGKPPVTIDRKRGEIRIRLDEEFQQELNKSEDKEKPSLMKSILKELNGGQVERLAFETDPTANKYYALYRTKARLIPDKILKRIAIQDDLVASIVQARQNHVSIFGTPRTERHSSGYVYGPTKETLKKIDAIQDPAQRMAFKDELQKKISSVSRRLSTCGDPNALGLDDRLTFSQYLSQSARNAVVVGRIATEIINKDNPSGEKEFSCFRPIDAGTIYRAAPQQSAAEQVRAQARGLLEQLKNKKLQPERFERDEYSWVQVIDDRPIQAFTSKECVVHNFYAVPDIELDGYPVTPLDTVIAAVTTHINITSHNKLYFQSGRATRGMLVIKSDDVDDNVVARVRQQFNASINSVSNSWRMPVFGVGQDDTIVWQPIDQGQRDMEFQYLTDMNARVILSAFAMSPDELPGWSYLSRGTNSQALSEANNEYKLEAARDLGIRPLLSQFEAFLNQSIMPLFDPELAKLCELKLEGLDADTAEKETTRLIQDMPVHMNMDEVQQKVEKHIYGKALGGEFPFNPQYQAILDKYFTVGQVMENFLGIEGASKDPAFAYVRDQFWFTWQSMLQAQQQMQQQAQQAQTAPSGHVNTPSADGSSQEPDQSQMQSAPKPSLPTDQDKNREVAAGAPQPGQAPTAEPATDLTRSIDQAVELLTKSEDKLPASKRRLLQHHKEVVKQFLDGWEQDLKDVNKEVLELAEKLQSKKS